MDPRGRGLSMRASARETVKSADRVLDVLELLVDTGRAMTHSEIALRTRIPKSSLTHLLRNLVRRRYLRCVADKRLFELGEAAFDLVCRGERIRMLVAICKPLLERLTNDTGESSALSLLRGDVVERVCSMNSTRAVLYAMHVGVRAPLYPLSTGKVFLAWMAPEQREAYLARMKFEPITPNTVTSAGALRRQLRAVRDEGVAYSTGEFTPGILGMAVPVMDGPGRVVAALGVALPASSVSEFRRLQLCRALRSSARVFRANCVPYDCLCSSEEPPARHIFASK